MSPALKVRELEQLVEAAEAELRSLRRQLAGWERLAWSGKSEVDGDELAKLGLAEKNDGEISW